ncbi:hypothetical protein AB0M54_45765 [Actinoplanes sp. NPDC051470]|uniref:hypothetical protein n=1 Tax=Actinoplanes sp. NPDC051470 TaxID=3157224 RepID=UPI003429CAEB
MQKEQSLCLTQLNAGWEAFGRLDQDDESHVTGFRILAHEPNMFCIARYQFETGVGYEYTYSSGMNPEEEEAVLLFYAGTRYRLLVREPFGWSEDGSTRTRLRAWMDARYM